MDDLGKSFENRMIVNGSQMEAEKDGIKSGIGEIIGYSLMDVTLNLNFVLVRKTVDFVNENFKLDIGVEFVGADDGHVQFVQCSVILVLSIDDENQRIASSQQFIDVEMKIKQVQLPGQVVDGEEDE